MGDGNMLRYAAANRWWRPRLRQRGILKRDGKAGNWWWRTEDARRWKKNPHVRRLSMDGSCLEHEFPPPCAFQGSLILSSMLDHWRWRLCFYPDGLVG
jgi:hypothetical protein